MTERDFVTAADLRLAANALRYVAEQDEEEFPAGECAKVANRLTWQLVTMEQRTAVARRLALSQTRRRRRK